MANTIKVIFKIISNIVKGEYLYHTYSFTQKPTAIYCRVLFSIGDYKLSSLLIRESLKISFSFL